MESRTKILGHPIHPMLIVFPLGLLATSLVFDIMYLITLTQQWAVIAFYLIGAGIIGGLAAAVFGFLDYLSIPTGTRARQIALLHGLGNLVIVILFFISWLMRRDNPSVPGNTAIILSFVGILLALVTGWLGGELVDRLGVGVDRGANLNSPNSLTGRPASENVPPPSESLKDTTPHKVS